eukprot:TRINITY_DN9042_c0_g1_i1.p1 TRINITY_DN9042_c0_g1~~TRINITY_DN9042_c0_g1_i1.p1  ORF type:complete len:274 (-),score=46.62 TRINITY_DN9042_c0_g1_i1:133-954(-)
MQQSNFVLPSYGFGPNTAYNPQWFSERNEFVNPTPMMAMNMATAAPTLGPKKRTTDPYVTGTSVLGIKYKDGIMLSADTLGSYGSLARYVSLERMKSVGHFTLIGAAGEYSDFQYLMTQLEELIDRDNAFDDGSKLGPDEIYNYVTRIMYARRNKYDPLWNQLLLGGFRDGKSFLGYIDSVGTSFEDDTLASGYGAHIARPLLRKAFKPDMSEQEARRVIEDCMRVLFYRDARTINKIQVATATKDGLTVSAPYELATQWDHCETALGYPRPN